jgi:RNA polymerase sigma-70 factor (ECF subfamily)
MLELPGEREAAASRERVLIQAARDGEASALTAIYEHQAPLLMRRLRLYTGDPELAAELVQDTFVIAFGDLRRFAGRSSLSTWLHGIAFNLARQAVRKRARRRELRSEHPGRLAAVRGSEPVDPEAAALMDEAADRLEAAIASLPLRLREAFITRVVERMPLREAATLLGVRVSTLSHRAKRAEAIVRAQFDQETER